MTCRSCSAACAGLALLAFVLAGCGTDVGRVTADAETNPVRHAKDAADDPCIWIHPGDPALSVVIGDDKKGGLVTYALDGRELQWIDHDLRLNNVDVRYGFPLAGTYANGDAHDAVSLISVADDSGASLRFYKMNPRTRALEPLGEVPTGRPRPYGSCMYRSRMDGRCYVFVNYRSGWTEQWQVQDGGGGIVAAAKVREFNVGSQVEGCVADDQAGVLYIGEERVAVWRYGAEPASASDPSARVRVAGLDRFAPDAEGLAIYHGKGGAGYLIVSSQGDDTFRIFARGFTAGEPNAYVGAFSIAAGAVDEVTGTDGIEVASLPLGPGFPDGLVVVQDDLNTVPGNTGNQNFKFVSWARVAAAFTPKLSIGTDYDPRAPQESSDR